MNEANPYFILLAAERQWSWSVIGIIYLLTGLIIRGLVFRRVIREAKQIDRNLYAALTKLYLKECWPGWVAFFSSFVMVMAYWVWGSSSSFGRLGLNPILLVGVPSLFLFSVILHFSAFTKALLTLLRQRMGMEREF